MTSLAVRLARLVACATVLLAAARPAEACSCRTGIPACETFWRTPDVFSAVVLDVKYIPDHSGQGYLPDRIATLQVEQTWRGNASGVIEVRTGTGGGDCGYTFTRGVRYLVYTQYRAGALGVSSCSRTRPLSEASEDLAYLRTAFQPSAAGRVYGSVTYQRTRSDDAARPLQRLAVTLRGADREWKTTTSDAGTYEFRVPAGRYAVHLDLPPTERAFGTRDVELADPRGCVSADFMVAPDGRIAMRVVDREGKPLGGMRVDFVKVDSMTESPAGRFPDSRPATSGPDGWVRVNELAPDRYVVGINVTTRPEPKQPYAPIFYPGVADVASARVIELGSGERVELEPFVLAAPLAERKISGVVRWPDGSPASGAFVSLWSMRGARGYGMPAGRGVTTGADGAFTVVGLAAERYRVHAYVDAKTADGARVQWVVHGPEFDADAERAPFVLTLAPPRSR